MRSRPSIIVPRMPITRIFRWFTLIFAAVALVLLVVTAVTVVRTLRFQAESVLITGTVEALIATGSSCDDDVDTCRESYAPRVRFTTEDGRSVTFTSTYSSSKPEFEVNDPIPVRYLRSDPSGARVASSTNLWFAPLVTGFLTVVFGGVGALWFGLSRKVRDRQSPWTVPPAAGSSSGPAAASTSWRSEHGSSEGGPEQATGRDRPGDGLR